MSPADDATSPQPAWAALRHRGFALLWTSRLAATFATQITSVAVGWQVYDLTRDPFDLGLVGLVQFAPALLLVLVTGAVADRFNRRHHRRRLPGRRGRSAPPRSSSSPSPAHRGRRDLRRPLRLRRRPRLPQPGAAVAGAESRSAGGARLGHRALVLDLAGRHDHRPGRRRPALRPRRRGCPTASRPCSSPSPPCLALLIPKPPQKTVPEPATWSTLVAGFRYVWHEKIVLGAISLDLFAVLLGGAIALLPAYARDILEVGPCGLGLLRSATGIGAMAMALYLAVRPVRDHAGLLMFACVILFGLFTLIFGVSNLVWLSVRRAGARRRRRHGQRLCPPDADPALDARRRARPRQCRQHRLRRRVERARRVPRRLGRRR